MKLKKVPKSNPKKGYIRVPKSDPRPGLVKVPKVPNKLGRNPNKYA